MTNHNDPHDHAANNPIRKNLEQQFQQLEPAEDTPENLKEEVFGTLDTLMLLGDVADLFTAKFIHSEAILLDFSDVRNNNDSNDSNPIDQEASPPKEDESLDEM